MLSACTGFQDSVCLWVYGHLSAWGGGFPHPRELRMAAPSWAELFFTGVIPVSKNFSARRIGVWGTLVCYPSRTEPLPKPIFGVKLRKRSFSHQQCHCSSFIWCVLLLQCTPCYVLLFNGYLAHPWDKTVWDPSEINSPSISIHWKFLWG